MAFKKLVLIHLTEINYAANIGMKIFSSVKYMIVAIQKI